MRGSGDSKITRTAMIEARGNPASVAILVSLLLIGACGGDSACLFRQADSPRRAVLRKPLTTSKLIEGEPALPCRAGVRGLVSRVQFGAILHPRAALSTEMVSVQAGQRKLYRIARALADLR